MNTARALYVCVLLTAVTVPLQAQTIDDGGVLPRHRLVVGDVYSQEQWDEYWEGTLKRTNDNSAGTRGPRSESARCNRSGACSSPPNSKRKFRDPQSLAHRTRRICR